MQSIEELNGEARVSVRGLQYLRHCLGINEAYPRKRWGYRNYFVCNDRTEALDQLVNAGLMTCETYNGKDVFPFRFIYRATTAGMQLVGLPESRIQIYCRKRRRL